MKKEIEELLSEMINNGTKPKDTVILNNSKENMDLTDFIVAREALMTWQKHVSIERGKFHLPGLLPNEMLIEAQDYARLEQLFRYSPELNALFKLYEDKVTFNESLTEDEVAEIRVYVHNNHYVKMHIRMPNRENRRETE